MSYRIEQIVDCENYLGEGPVWDIETGQKLDKDVFRRDLGSLTDAYTEVAQRLGVLAKNIIKLNLIKKAKIFSTDVFNSDHLLNSPPYVSFNSSNSFLL